MPKLSFAQNAEDVVLARVFTETSGFYVDVGAGHPVFDSVTKHFYDLGWRGVNIEPLAEEAEMLRKERPEDVNLELAVSDHAGSVSIFVGPPENRGSSTLEQALADSYRQSGQQFVERQVEVATLGSILEKHVDRPIDFLRLDVAGHEEKVLRGVDLTIWRPRVMIVEATCPNSIIHSEQKWEPILTAAGYRRTLFDGVNRFYIREDETSLAENLSTPASVLDDFVPLRFSIEIEALSASLDAATAALAHADPALQKLEEAREEAERYALDLQGRVQELELELEASQQEAAASAQKLRLDLHAAQDELAAYAGEIIRKDEVAEAARRVSVIEAKRRIEIENGRGLIERQRDAFERELSRLQNTKTFRWTAGPRQAYGRLRAILQKLARPRSI